MSGMKQHDPAFGAAGRKITPDEIDSYYIYTVNFPTTSATWFGTCAGGTAGQAKALVVTNKGADYPRNLLYGVVGTADMGGSWTVNGKDQFGQVVSETVVLGTAAAGTPAAAVAGTQIFSEVTSGTFTVDASGVGAGSARLGVAIGTAATALYRLGFPVKIGAYTDVKRIAWTSQFVGTAINGGTVGTAQVDASRHAYLGQSIMAGTETFQFRIRPTYDNSNKTDIAGL